jgi:hypothetical protein
VPGTGRFPGRFPFGLPLGLRVDSNPTSFATFACHAGIPKGDFRDNAVTKLLKLSLFQKSINIFFPVFKAIGRVFHPDLYERLPAFLYPKSLAIRGILSLLKEKPLSTISPWKK